MKDAREEQILNQTLHGIAGDILDSMDLAVFVLDRNFKILWVNKNAERLFNTVRDFLLGADKVSWTKNHLHRIISMPKDFSKQVLDSYEQGIHLAGLSCNLNNPETGDNRWLLYWSKPIEQGPLKGGRVEYYFDYTEQRKLIRNIFDHIGAATVILEEDTTISLANTQFEILSGYRRDELEGKMPWTIFVTDEDLERMTKFHWDRRETSKNIPEEYEFRFITRNGEVKHILNRVSLIPGTNKSIACLWDITERKKTENALAEAEEKYRTIANFAQDCIVLIQDGTTVYRNPYYEKLIGYKVGERGGKEFLDIVVPEDRERIKAFYERRLKGESTPMPYEVTVMAKDGKRYTMEVRSTLVHYRGKPSVMAVMRDITERKRAEREKENREAQLRQSQKMEAIGTLAGGIAHDFNNILAAIVGYTELALLDIPSSSPARSNVEAVLTSALRAKELIKQILSFSRKAEEKRIQVSMGTLIKEALKMLRASLPKSITIVEDIKSNAFILADPVHIHQVLMNLCTNSAHAMRDAGGTLKISLVETDLKTAIPTHGKTINPGSYIRLSVEDTGHGISPEIIEKIFDPYFTTKEKGEGTGLGLAVVHGIVESHNGGILVQSKIGEGTKFDVYFPKVSEKKEAKKSEKKQDLPTGNEKIFFVDDEFTLVDIGKKMLSTLGYKVETETNGLNALEIFMNDPYRFDLIVTDMSMPGLTGDKLIKRIKALRPDLPIILCTGYNEKLTNSMIHELGIHSLIMKPYVITDLAREIRLALDKRNK